jgi:twinkle protein
VLTTKTFADYGIDTKGKTSGEVKTVCPQCSPNRKKRTMPCLNVNLDKGVWNCWHCDWAGGLARGQWQAPQRLAPQWRRPDYVAKSDGIPPETVAWFAKRGITESVLRRNQIGRGVRYFPQVEEERTCVLFPYLRGNEVVNIKSRTREKFFRMESGCERVLYGLNDIAERLVWVEGEMDKLSVEVAGITSCVSVPDGAPSPESKSYATKFDFMDAPELGRAMTHVIAVDADEPGVRLKDELIRRLGREACLVVTWPDGCKDANDVLVQYGPAILRGCIDDAEPLPVEGAHQPADFLQEMLEDYEHGRKPGVSTGWKSLDENYTVLPGEWTLVTGVPGHGKSEWLDALAVNLAMQHGYRFAVYSAENMPVREHLGKLAEKYIGKPFDAGPTERMSRAELDRAMTWMNQHFTVLLPDSPTPARLVEMCRALVLQRGINGIIFDPWNEIEHTFDDKTTETKYISETLSMLRRFARNHDVHLWLVAHPRMLQRRKDGSDKEPVPSPYEIAGSAHWNNKADNIICVWRDRAADTGDVDIHVQKVRKKRVGRVGLVSLRYDRVTGRYHDPMRDAEGRVYTYSFGGTR